MGIKIPPRPRSTGLAIEADENDASWRSAKLAFGSVGEDCGRKLWYEFHWAHKQNKIPAKLQRLFNRGKYEEAVVYEDLRRVNCEVTDDQKNVIGFAGHAKGKIDGIVIGIHEAPVVKHVLEIKTMMQKYWLPVKKKGLKKGYFKYYVTVQLYMHYLKLTRTFLVATNKNTEERVYERIYYDKKDASEYVKKSMEIILSEKPLPRAFNRGDFRCINCASNTICWESDTPERNCRTCEFADLHDSGRWLCTNNSKEHKELSYLNQIEGCENYKIGF